MMRLVVLLTAAALMSCADPVDDEPSSARSTAPSEAPGSHAAGERTHRSGGDHTGRDDARERVAEAAHTDSVAAEVAAGHEDGGVEDARPPVALSPSADGAAPAPAADSAPTGATRPPEPSEYLRPELHADVLPDFRILRFALAEDVVEREPVMISSRFRQNSGPMHVFLEVSNQTGEDVTLMVGFRPANTEQRGGGVSLTIPSSPRYRTRARANTRRAVGEWVCEVMDERQRVLVTQRFFIVPADPTSAAGGSPD